MSNEKKTKWQLLAEPMPFKWKIQSFNKDKTKGTCVGYVDARDVMARFDEVLGPDCWQRIHKQVGNLIVCGIGIKDDKGSWIFKEDVGAENDIEMEKSIISDSFKRCAVNWGVGRFLYDLDIKYVNISNGKPVDNNGQIIWNLTEHFNGKTKAVSTATATPANTTPAAKREELPWLSEAQYQAMLDFIKEGKQEIVRKQMANYRMKKVFRESLNKQLEPQEA